MRWAGPIAMNEKELFSLFETSFGKIASFSKRSYQIGPCSVDLLFAPPSLEAKFGRALSHLAIDSPPTSDLTLAIWDSAHLRIPLPSFDWGKFFSSQMEQKFPFRFYHQEEGISAIDLDRGIGYFIVRDAKTLPWWTMGSPFQILFHLWFRSKGMQVTHAGAIANDKGALLLTGKGGSGKSTTIFSCVKEQMRSIGEDYILLSQNPPTAWSLYQSMKWTQQTRGFFPDYEAIIANPREAQREKALLFSSEVPGIEMERGAPLKAIVSLQLGEKRAPSLSSEDFFISLSRLSLSTLQHLPFYHKDSLDFFRKIQEKLPAYTLFLGRDLKKNVELLQDLLK